MITPHTQEHVDRFTDIMIMKMMGWTYSQLMETPKDVYEDLLLILNKQSARGEKK